MIEYMYLEHKNVGKTRKKAVNNMIKSIKWASIIFLMLKLGIKTDLNKIKLKNV